MDSDEKSPRTQEKCPRPSGHVEEDGTVEQKECQADPGLMRTLEQMPVGHPQRKVVENQQRCGDKKLGSEEDMLSEAVEAGGTRVVNRAIMARLRDSGAWQTV